jgi:hypothetical protein
MFDFLPLTSRGTTDFRLLIAIPFSLGLLIQFIEPLIGPNVISDKFRRALLCVKNTMILTGIAIAIALAISGLVLYANEPRLSD